MEHGGQRLHILALGECKNPPVLLLHGRLSTAEIWRTLGTLNLLAVAGYRAVAIDMPGYGCTDDFKVSQNAFVAEILPALEVERPVVVAPSFSARFAFPMMIRYPGFISGVVAVGAMGAEQFGPRLGCTRTRTMVVWGENDARFPVSVGRTLAGHIPGARFEVLSGAGHECHLDCPDLFNELLLAFVGEVYGRPPQQ